MMLEPLLFDLPLEDDTHDTLETAAEFKTWLSNLLAVHAHRPALQDEFKTFTANLK